MFYLLKKKSVNKVLLIVPCYGWRNRGLEKFDISKIKLKVKWPKWDWIKIQFFSRFQALNDGYIQHCQLSATSMKSRLNGPSKKGTDSLVELINKLPGEIHTTVYTDIFFLATNTNEMNSECHVLTVHLKVRLTVSVPQFLLWPWSVLSTLFIKVNSEELW